MARELSSRLGLERQLENWFGCVREAVAGVPSQEAYCMLDWAVMGFIRLGWKVSSLPQFYLIYFSLSVLLHSILLIVVFEDYWSTLTILRIGPT